MTIKILQWNIRGFRTSAAELQYLVHKEDIQVVCLQETMRGPDVSPPHLPGFRTYHVPCTPGPGNRGVALLVKNHLPQSAIDLPTDLQNIQATAARVQLGSKLVSIISAYTPSNALQEADIVNVISACHQPVLLTGDFNAHHDSWGDPETIPDANGLHLHSSLEKTNLYPLNNGSPTFIRLPSQTSIDVTAASPALALSC